MKYTNIKKLLIKFMGGGLINFPTRFLRWIKIDGDADGNDGGGGGDDSGDNNDVFFVPATIQPKYFINAGSDEPIDIKNYISPESSSIFLYNKEDIISLGVNEEDLNNLNIITPSNAYNDAVSNNGANGYQIPSIAFMRKIILDSVNIVDSVINIYSKTSYIYKISDDIFLIVETVNNTDMS